MSRRRRTYAFLGLLLVVATLLLGGFDARARPSPRDRRDSQPLDPDWVAVSGMLNAKCLKCHLPGDEFIPLTDYDALLRARTFGDDSPLIVPGHPNESALVQVTRWSHAEPGARPSDPEEAPRMPPDDENWLTAGQYATLTRWIRNGATRYLPIGTEQCLTEADFPSAQQCKVCHPKQFEEWSRSMHAYAQQSPVFEAFTLTMLERTSGTVGTFCTRCHTPVGVALGETGLRRNRHRSALALEGVTCVACHRRSHASGRVNARFAIEPGDLMDGCVYGPFDDVSHDESERHRAAGSPFIRSSSFCGSCHDVTTPDGLRLEEAFSEWKNSPAAKRGVTCQHCHMGPEPGIAVDPRDRPMGYAAIVPGADPSKRKPRPLSDHTFAGPDYSMLPDTHFPHTLDWIREQGIPPESERTDYQHRTLASLRERNHEALANAAVQRYRLLRNAAKLSVDPLGPVKPGGRVRLKVEVESLFDGHGFPTGFSAERQAWVEVLVHDQEGRLLFASGDLDSNGDLRDEHSHAVLTGRVSRDRFLMNFQSKFVIRAFRGTERPVTIPVNRDLGQVNVLRPARGIGPTFGRPGTIRIQKSNLAPLATRRRIYRFRAPTEPQRCTYTVRLLFRNLPPHLLDEIKVGYLKSSLQVVEIDARSGTFEVASGRRRSSSRVAPVEP